MNIEFVLPNEIEKRSFEIIGNELEKMGITLDAEQEPITKRVIHTSADFDYANTMYYSVGSIAKAKEMIKAGAHIVTDTNMALAGINKKRLFEYGGQVHCFMADEDVAAEAKSRQVTRATVSMERAAIIFPGDYYEKTNQETDMYSCRCHNDYKLICLRRFKNRSGRS